MPNSAFRIFAHRGANTDAPENTLQAFRLAFERGALWLECDLHETRDGHFVILHDADLRRTTNSSGLVSQLSLETILQAKTENGEPPPTLSQVFEVLPPDAGVDLELKQIRSIDGFLGQLFENCKRFNVAYDRLLISSFNPQLLVEIRRRARNLPLGILIDQPMTRLRELYNQLSASALGVSDQVLDKALIAEAHDLGMKIFVFTVNDPLRAQELQNAGVDGIFSDVAHSMKSHFEKT